jgi:N6-L-threonylcarbamoyladenine synthase
MILASRTLSSSPPKGEKNIVILAIETSCDETSAAVLEIQPSPPPSPSPYAKATEDKQGRGEKFVWPKIKTLSAVVKSQITLHKHMGGVVPETAARAHVKYIRPVVEQALLNAKGYSLNAIDYLAVTTGPGLLPSLMVGVEFAKTLSFATNIPLIPVNHMAGHLYSPFGLPTKRYPLNANLFPMISLIVSGGHTMLVLMQDIKTYKVLGQTLDDAAGEAFDKVAKMLKLPYPGGPVVSRLAKQGNPNAIKFPRPMLDKKNYNFSFSGLKTAVLYYLQSLPTKRYPLNANSPLPPSLANEGAGGVANICASFQQAVIDVLVTKTLRAVKEFRANSVSLSGGVAANKQLREQLMVNCKLLNVNFMVPPINLCTDNAEMIGMTAGFMLNNGFKPKTYKHLTANPNLTL